jgi:hypothetical protein
MSCRQSYTAQLDGKCAPVSDGFVHGSDCIATAATTCGLDGRCDGAGACRKHVAGTTCAAESCTDGTALSTYSAARTCDGFGICMSSVTSNCGSTYRCVGTLCRSICNNSTDCAPGAYCAGDICLIKKREGDLCSADAECGDGTCGGRCCAAGCTCSQPSAKNFLNNPGLDKDASGWTITKGTVSRSLMDAELCRFSGSLVVTIPAGGDNRVLHQCVSNTPFKGDFTFGAKVQTVGGSVASVQACQVNFYSGTNCDADLVVQQETDPQGILSGWQALSGTVSTVSGANSVDFACYLLADATADASFYLDMLYVSRAPDRY